MNNSKNKLNMSFFDRQQVYSYKKTPYQLEQDKQEKYEEDKKSSQRILITLYSERPLHSDSKEYVSYSIDDVCYLPYIEDYMYLNIEDKYKEQIIAKCFELLDKTILSSIKTYDTYLSKKDYLEKNIVDEKMITLIEYLRREHSEIFMKASMPD